MSEIPAPVEAVEPVVPVVPSRPTASAIPKIVPSAVTEPIAETSAVLSATPTPNKYNELLFDLFTWKKPICTGKVFGATLAVLFVLKYISLLKLVLNTASIAFATAVAVEFAGRYVKKSPGFLSSFSDGRYFTVSKGSVEPLFEELLVVVNFVLVELQKIVYVEKTSVTVSAVFGSYFAYVLVHHISVWTLVLMTVLGAFAVPPIYLKYQTEIDAQIAKGKDLAGAQYKVLEARSLEQYGKYKSVAGEQFGQALSKVGYKRNFPPVPAAESTLPEKLPESK
ncbi:putative reticulon-like protein RtnA [Lipomyces oligophaga]|uniref:putative reticulon-like protein RtnA n=1 Tax=Lipomyces oligophaga TaxID=45792 RepID=UPI0034CD2482